MKDLYDIWFSNLDIENNKKLKLLEKYTAEEIYQMNFEENELDNPNRMKILNARNLDEEKKMQEYMLNKQVKLISIRDKKYPHKLHHIDDKPAFLYVRGNEDILDEDSVRNSWLSIG